MSGRTGAAAIGSWRGGHVRGPAVLVATLLAACGDSGTAPAPGPDLDALFLPATAAEIAAVEAEWAARGAPAAVDVRVEHTGGATIGGEPATLSIVSHVVDGHRHYGALLAPDGAAAGSLPVLVYAHGGDGGVDVGELLLLAAALDGDEGAYVWVVPSFRSEPLVLDGETWMSEGEPSPWDRDVDDALALVEVALQEVAAADGERVGVLGMSRGAGVGLLMAARDARIDVVVEFFGPTDFLGSYVRGIVEATLAGDPPDLPGLDYLDATFLQPWVEGRLATEAVRLAMVRRSAVLFVERLPDVQIHHGTADGVVDVSQAESLIAALEAAGRGLPADEWYLYEGGGHHPLSLPGSIPRTVDFLARLGG